MDTSTKPPFFQNKIIQNFQIQNIRWKLGDREHRGSTATKHEHHTPEARTSYELNSLAPNFSFCFSLDQDTIPLVPVV
jgi:hypothetical protein